MIDDPAQVNALMEKMKACLPIPVKVTNTLLRCLHGNGTSIASHSSLQIIEVAYFGDEGGICCGLNILGKDDTAFMVSITHLSFPNTHKLASQIRFYQKARTEKLAKVLKSSPQGRIGKR